MTVAGTETSGLCCGALPQPDVGQGGPSSPGPPRHPGGAAQQLYRSGQGDPERWCTAGSAHSRWTGFMALR